MKLELNVKKFNNEDVIATSGEFCSNHTDHYLVTGGPSGYYNATKYWYDETTSTWYYTTGKMLLQDNKEVNHYYYYDNGCKECTGEHNTTNCIENND